MTIRVFVSGQSNALGRGTGGPAFSGVTANVRIWNNVNPLGSNGNAFVSAATAQAGGTFEFTDRNNFAVWFCDKLSRKAFENVDMTIVARGATTISAWAPTEVTVPMLAECTDVWAATGQAPADIFIWHQGEGDVSTPESTYTAAFIELVSNLKAAGVINNSTIIMFCGTAGEDGLRVRFNRSAQTRIVPLLNNRIVYVPVNRLTTSDGTHFTGTSLFALGSRKCYAAWRYASAKI